jgi:HTH-type transcriptional regulator / antitoxin HipB
MKKIDENKLTGLHTAGELLDEKYGEVGTESRTAFHEKSVAWYYGEILRDRRKQLKITQQELADKVGTARSYIARVEKGETDIQISSFFSIAQALGIKFIPTVY